MNNYCDYITADLLKELIGHNFPAYKYSVGGYDGKPVYYTKDLFDPDWRECDAYKIPTYAEVMDWFMSKGIVITLEPFFTFALKDNVGYNWKISYIVKECEMKTITEKDTYTDKGYGGSFNLIMDNAIRYAMYHVLNIINMANKKTTIDVNGKSEVVEKNLIHDQEAAGSSPDGHF